MLFILSLVHLSFRHSSFVMSHSFTIKHPPCQMSAHSAETEMSMEMNGWRFKSNLLWSKKRWLTDDPLQVFFLDKHWVQLGRGLTFSILPFHLGARMPQITQRIQTKSHCPFRQWLPFSVISLRPSSGTAIIPTKTSDRGVERWQTTNIHLRTESKLYQTNN